MNIAGFGNLVACYCAFDYRWRPVARDEGDPPFSWSLSYVLGIRGSNAGLICYAPNLASLLAGALAEHALRVESLCSWSSHSALWLLNGPRHQNSSCSQAGGLAANAPPQLELAALACTLFHPRRDWFESLTATREKRRSAKRAYRRS